jgi:hypothetical protein
LRRPKRLKNEGVAPTEEKETEKEEEGEGVLKEKFIGKIYVFCWYELRTFRRRDTHIRHKK